MSKFKLLESLRTIVVAAVMVAPSIACAKEIVRDAWADGTCDDPAAAAGFSENGADADNDGDLESVWFRGGGGSLAAAAKGGPLQAKTAAGSSSSWTTYFAPEGAVKLDEPGDQLKLTWRFTPTGVNEIDAGQPFRVALVDSPAEARLKDNGSPPSAAYKGYALFMNMNTRLSHSSSLQLRKRAIADAPEALLSTSAPWLGVAVGGSEGQTGYVDGTEYTLEFTVTRNDKNGLDVAANMSGGELSGAGSMSLEYTDDEPGSFEFDTFAIRTGMAENTAKEFDTKLFKVELNNGAESK